MINRRLAQLVEYKRITPRAFSMKIGVSSQVFGNYLKDRDPSFDTLVKIIETFDDINAEWLLTGNGSMLKPTEPQKETTTDDQSRLWAMIESQQRMLESQQRIIENLSQKGNEAAGGARDVAPKAARG